jgi:pyruvate-formate lyase-activating enzyme
LNPAIQAELKRKSAGAKVKTRIYHISYAPDIKKAYLFFWGCNLKCRGCLCKKEINCLALEENLDVVLRDPGLALPQSPAKLLLVNEVMDILGKVEVKEVLFEGQEASIDPLLPRLCAALKQEFGCRITLNTNGVKLPDLKDIDEVVLSLKAVTPGLYKDYTERSNKSVLRNFLKLYHAEVKLRTETVFIPGYIDLEETEKIARFVASVDSGIPLRIDAYFVSGDNPWRRALPAEMAAAVQVAQRHLANVTFTQQEKPVLTKKDLMFEVVRLY